MKATGQFPKTLCILLGAVGLAAYVFVGWVDYIYGEATAFSAEGKASQPIIMVIVSVAGFCFISAAGAAARVRYYTAAFLMAALSIGCMAYSGLNGVGFFAGETMSLTRQAEAKNKASADATNKANEVTISMRKEAFDWMKGTRINTSKERERVEDKVIDLATRPVEIKTVDVQASVVDARSVAMKKIFGMDVENAQLTNSVWLVAILLGCKLLGPSLAFALWPGIPSEMKDPYLTDGSEVISELRVTAKTRDEALAWVRATFPSRSEPFTVAFVADHCGVSRSCAYYWFRDWKDQGAISLAHDKEAKNALYIASLKPSMAVVGTTKQSA